jgi:hypothetical protein
MKRRGDPRLLSRPFTVLLDGMIRPWGITHEWRLRDQTVKWGTLTVTLPVEVVSPRPQLESKHNWLQAQIDCLPHVAALARNKVVKFYKTIETDFETWGRPNRVGRGTEFDVFWDVPIEEIPPAMERTIILGGVKGETKEGKNRFLDSIHESRFLELRAAIGKKHSGDIFHLWSAEKAGLDCFLTVDCKFVNAFRHQKRTHSNVAVVFPTELCERFRCPER